MVLLGKYLSAGGVGDATFVAPPSLINLHFLILRAVALCLDQGVRVAPTFLRRQEHVVIRRLEVGGHGKLGCCYPATLYHDSDVLNAQEIFAVRSRY